MDTYTEAVTCKRRYLALEEKRRIVEETLSEGASVALVARTHGVNANLLFTWRKLYQAGRLDFEDFRRYGWHRKSLKVPRWNS
jgi:transposase